MKFSIYCYLLLVLTSSLQASGLSSGESVESYAFNLQPRNNDAQYKCASCPPSQEWFGSFSPGVGFSHSDNARFRNWVPTINNDDAMGILNADATWYGSGSEYGRVKVENLGLERFRVAAEQGNYDGLRLKLDYSQSPWYGSNHLLSAYAPDRDNPLIEGDKRPFDKKSLRKKMTASVNFTPQAAWHPYASISHESKKATLTRYLHTADYNPNLLPKVVDSTTTLLKSGISYRGKSYLIDLAYQGSLYNNQHTILAFGQASNPWANKFAYEPDNSFHQLSLSGQYNWTQQSLIVRLLANRATSNADLTPYQSRRKLQQNNFYGAVDTTQMDGKWTGRFNKDLTLRGGVDYRTRDDRSDTHFVAGKRRDSGDRKRGKADFSADYRLSRSVKLTGGYQYRFDQREDAVRKDVNEQTLFVKGRYQPAGPFSMASKLTWRSRSGSDWRSDVSGSPTLREYYLADRERIEWRVDGGYQFNQGLDVTLEGWLAQDNYQQGDAGRSKDRDYGVDISLYNQLSDKFSWRLFGNMQWIASDQHHAYYVKKNNLRRYSSTLKDKVATVGLGINNKNTFDKDLELSLEYSLSQSWSTTDSGESYDFADQSGRFHRLEGTALYQINPHHAVRWVIGYEYSRNGDYLYGGEELNLGYLDENYNDYYSAIFWIYTF